MIDGIPIGLKSALESGECVLFLGSGIGYNMLGADGKPAPDGTSLAQEMAVHFDVETTNFNLAKIAEVVQGRHGRPALEDFLRKRLANLQPDANLRWLLARRWQAIFTTNYDSGIERAYELNDKPRQNPISISATHQIVHFDVRLDVPIYHVHGALFGGHQGGVVITESDYVTFRDRRRMLFELLKHKFATLPMLYAGYANQDPNWKLVWDELCEEFLPSTPPVSYRVSPTTDPLDAEILKAKGVESIGGTLQEFVAVASSAVSDANLDVDRLQATKALVPSQLLEEFQKTPAAVLRLVASWTYVNQASFTEKPNASSFLWGDRPNWGLIASRQHFVRDIEDEICDDTLDFLTGNPKSPTALLTLGSAGYGVSTLLMCVAVRLVQEGATTVFMHRHGTALNEGDILFAASLSKQPTVFIVDDAADNVSAIHGAITHLRTNKIPALFILGERLNEWRQRRTKVTGKEFVLEPLSSPEIMRLLDCLGSHNALNKLAPLTRELQISVIREKHGKELLVAMREATEGKGFDAILEGEYRGIATTLGRSAYLAASCFYQHGAYLRDGLMAQILQIDLPRFYEETKGILDGVVVYDCIDEAQGTYGARARHRTIAEVIWERCGDLAERDRMLQSALRNLNLNYRADVNAFEHFIRSDRIVDGIRTFEGKVQFFEAACRKDPTSPYVRQHYARMLTREDKPDLALSQIEEGFKIRSNAPPRVLFHTKGVILTHLTKATESESFARRRLVQGEDAFRKAMTLNPKDEYTYQGLATLYLEWAKRASSEVEATEYVEKAEVVISDGLRKVKERDGLWILTAQIEKWLGDTPSHVKALETAVASSPGSVIARYLLGRTYRFAKRPEKALWVLEPVIKDHPDEYRSFIEYALALLDLGKPIETAVAVMNISSTHGLSDARYVATFGGLLFISGKYDEAAKVFQESVRREFPYTEATAIHFRPQNPPYGTPITVQGKVIVVKPHFALMEAEGFPKLLIPSSKFGKVKLIVGATVRCNLEFSAKSPVAAWPQLIK